MTDQIKAVGWNVVQAMLIAAIMACAGFIYGLSNKIDQSLSQMQVLDSRIEGIDTEQDRLHQQIERNRQSRDQEIRSIETRLPGIDRAHDRITSLEASTAAMAAAMQAMQQTSTAFQLQIIGDMRGVLAKLEALEREAGLTTRPFRPGIFNLVPGDSTSSKIPLTYYRSEALDDITLDEYRQR